MSDLDTIRRTLQTHTPAGKDKRHDGCSCFAEALESLARVEAVITAARQLHDVYYNQIGFMDPSDGTSGSVLLPPDYTLLEDADEALADALSNLSPSTPVRDPIDPLCGRPLSEHSPLPGNGIDHDDISCPSTPVKEGSE